MLTRFHFFMSNPAEIPQNELFTTATPLADLDRLVALAREQGASKLLILAGKPVLARVNGRLSDPLLPGRIHFRQSELLAAALLSPEAAERLDQEGSVEIDYSPAAPAGALPLRINVFFGDGAHNLVVFLSED